MKKEEIDEKKIQLISLCDNAVSIINQNIKALKENSNLKGSVKMLQIGLKIVEDAKEYFKLGVDEDIKIPKGKRGGLSLTRGFSEFDCSEEVYYAVAAIEDYYRTM